MKNSIIVFIGLLGLLMAGCTGRDSKPELLSEHEDSSKPTKFVVSIPAIVLNKVLTDSSSLNHTTQENLKELWNFDNQFSEALARGRSLGPRILTRKINPCCLDVKIDNGRIDF